MQNDTMKSLSFLKKSLKMNSKAISNNEMPNPGQNIPQDVFDFLSHSKAMLDQIELWEKSSNNLSQPAAPVVVTQNIPSTVSPVDDNDLLTVP